MRLDFRNIGKGLEAIAGAKQARDLAQESARYDVTEGAYGPGLQENIQQLEGLKAQDPAQAPAYDQAIAELTRRQGLTAPDYSVASGAQNYGTRQEARQAAAPMRAEGLAGVYRRYGDVAQADTLEARAYEQQRALAAEERAKAAEADRVARRPLEIKQLEGQIANQAQQGLLTGAQLTDIQRKQNLQAALDARLADINTQTFEKPEMRTQAVLSLVEELQGPQAAAQLRASYSGNELNEISLQAKKFDEGFRQSRAKGVIPALEWFDEQNTSFKLERDPKNPFRVIQVNQDGSRQLFADAKNERELGMIVDAKAKPGGWLELAKYDLDQKKADAAIRASDSTANLNATRAKGLERDDETLKKLDAIDSQIDSLTAEEAAGEKGRGLLIKRNAIVAGATKQVPVGAATRAARPALTEAEVTNRAEKYVSTRQKNPDTGKIYTLDEAIERVRGTPPAPGTPAAARASLDALLGGGDPFATPPATAPATAPQQSRGLSTPAPARDAPVAPNPYVDARGRPLAVAPAGAPSIASTAIPAAASAVEGAVGTQAAATRYLQAKIARNEPLTPTDRARAVQLGLIR
jgi:hypothetical protein